VKAVKANETFSREFYGKEAIESMYLGNLESGFPLSHPDFRMDNIFVDDDLNITYIIDWAFSSTVPISTLMTPSLPHPRDDVDTTLVPTFRASFTRQFLGKRYQAEP
jgi:hypothetical protein